MNCSMLLTSLQTPTAATSGAIVPLGSAVHGFGKAITLNGNTIILNEAGYYGINASASVAVTGANAATITIYRNGIPVTSATASATPTAAGAVINLSIPWVIRKSCGCSDDVISFVIDQAGTINSMIVEVSKI